MPLPDLDLDLYSDEVILDPYPVYRRIRDLGPVVRLARHDAVAIGRFDEVRSALLADDRLVSGRGVAMNDLVNADPARVTLTTDGDLHRRLRSVLTRPMTVAAMRGIEGSVQRLADELVDRLAASDGFDGIADLAAHLPIAVVAHLVGLPEDGRERMRDWAAATFDALGAMNDRVLAALPAVLEMVSYAASVDRRALRADGWAARLFEAADRGEVEATDVPGMLVDYIAPSLDTTILGTGHLLLLLGRHPAEWERVRADETLVPRAVDEALRVETPVRAFARHAASDVHIGGTTIPSGTRVLVLFASANRDERRYPDPDRFDVGRDARDHLGFGLGVHRCAGAHLAQLEMSSLLRAMRRRVARIEVGDPVPMANNLLRGWRSFPAAFHD